jgi:hypothetical protein
VKRWLGAFDPADSRLSRRAALFLCGGAPRIRWVEYRRTCVALFLSTFNAMAVATFNYFHCVSVVHDGASVALVFAYPAVRCDGAAYRSWLWLPIVVLIELAALSALLARKLHRSHKKPDEVDSAFKYLREPYQRRFYW